MSAEINQFVDPISGRIDMNAWRHDICGRMQTDHVGPENGIGTRELCMIYFGYVDTDKFLFMGYQIQIARRMLLDRAIPMILRNHSGQWYVVAPEDTGGARGFLTRFSTRFVRAGRRLRTYAGVCQETYQLPSSDPLVTAIEGSQPTLDRVDRAIELPSGEHNEEQENSQDESHNSS